MSKYQGTQAEIMQVLADHIGRLNERVTILEDRTKAHIGVLSLIGGTFKITNPELLEVFVGTVTRLRDFHANPDNYASALTLDEEQKAELPARLQRMVEEFDTILSAVSDPKPVRFTAVKGDKG
ncbi:hypothetical protein [Rhizobium herbae]